MDSHVKSVVILGGFGHEGIESAIESRGFYYDTLSLHGVLPRTWLKRVALLDEMLEADELAAVIVYLPTPTFLHGCGPEFKAAWRELIIRLEKVRSIVFMYEDNMAGEFYYVEAGSEERLTLQEAQDRFARLTSEYDYGYDRLRFAIENMQVAEEHSENIDALLKLLHTSDIELCPFRSRSDVTIRIHEFLEEVDDGIFLRLYVPHERWQADQIASFLRTFERYLTQVEGIAFAVDSQKTERGVIYYFRADNSHSSLEELDAAANRFDIFMKMCRDDPGRAEQVLNDLGVNSGETSYLVAKYAKEYHRILMDTRHEMEHKTLRLRQRLENDVFELSW